MNPPLTALLSSLLLLPTPAVLSLPIAETPQEMKGMGKSAIFDEAYTYLTIQQFEQAINLEPKLAET